MECLFSDLRNKINPDLYYSNQTRFEKYKWNINRHYAIEQCVASFLYKLIYKLSCLCIKCIN